MDHQMVSTKIRLIILFVVIDGGESNGTPLQYSCLENPMDGGALWAAVHGVDKSQTRLSDFTFLSFSFQSLPSGSFHKPLILLHQRADRLKTTVTEN